MEDPIMDTSRIVSLDQCLETLSTLLCCKYVHSCRARGVLCMHVVARGKYYAPWCVHAYRLLSARARVPALDVGGGTRGCRLIDIRGMHAKVVECAPTRCAPLGCEHVYTYIG